MIGFIRFCHGVLIWPVIMSFIIVYFVLASCFYLVFFFVPKRGHYLRLFGRPFLKGILWMCGNRLLVKGAENLPEEGSFVYIVNHQSMLDILVLLIAIPHFFSFVSKKEMAKVPFIGLSMVMQGHFFINRDKPRQAMEEMAEVTKVVRDGRSLALFPEGTRSRDGEILPFKRGVFKLALETGTPIVPCYIHNSLSCLPPNTLLPRPGKIHLVYGAPIDVDVVNFQSKSHEKDVCQALSDRVRDAVCQLKLGCD